MIACTAGFLRALRAGDIDAAVRCFTPDGTFASPGRPVVHGASALREAFARFLADAPSWNVEITDAYLVDADLAFIRFRYRRDETATEPSTEAVALVRGCGDAIASWQEYHG